MPDRPEATLMSLIKMMLVMVSVAAISKTFGLLRFLLRLSFLRSEERFSRNAETDLVCRLLLEKKKMALGLLRAMHERGHRIPGAISVVGFDDIPEAQYFMPPLTTVRQDFAEMGRSALRMLLDAMQNSGQPGARLTVAPELVVRRSTGPPPAGKAAPV